MSTVPTDLNWVEKRAECTTATVFNQLCDGIMSDVEAINSAKDLSEFDRFGADMHSSGTTIFVGRPNRIPRVRLAIGIINDEIAVQQEWAGGLKWSASVGLNDEGRCILKVKDDAGKDIELEQWQFRKRALEGLFFGE